MLENFNLILQESNDLFNEEDNIVLLTFDVNYIDQSVNLMESIIRYNKNVSFICLCTQLNDTCREILMQRNYGVCIYEYSVDLKEGKINLIEGRWPVVTLFRLFAPWLITEPVSEVLYFDSDMICKGNIQELLNMKSEDYLLALCNEIRGNIVQMDFFSQQFRKDIYCNSGTLKLNIAKMREEYSPSDIMKVLYEKADAFVFSDQDLLNYYFHDKIYILNNFLYNFQAYELRKSNIYKLAVEKAKVIHFSIGKPWDYKTNFDLIKLYISLSSYKPIIEKCRKAYKKRILMLPILVLEKILLKLHLIKSK